MLMKDYIPIAEAAERWGISQRQAQHLCTQGSVEGAVKFGRVWMIPKDAAKPTDGRTKVAKSESDANMPMPRKSPFLAMTDLYTVPGTADECALRLAGNPEAQALFAAEIAYSRGEIDKVIAYTPYFLASHSGFYAVNAGGMLLALAAIWKGDINLYRSAKVHICEAPAKDEADRDNMTIALACINTAVRDIANYPEWFRYGQFERLPPDSHPAAKVFYIKFFIIAAQEQAKGVIKLPDVTGMGLMRVIPYIAEPLISRVVAEKLVVPEIYLRLLVAIAYHQLGENPRAITHIDKAIALALPDRLLGILAEHRRNLDTLLDERLELADADAYRKYLELHGGMIEGWTRLHNSLLSGSISNSLTPRQREICRLAAFGMSDAEIARVTYLSLSTVKKEIHVAKNKTGMNKREELGAFI